MSRPMDIPQVEYDAAADALLESLDGSFDLDVFRSVQLLHQAADATLGFASREVLERFALSWSQYEVLWNIWVLGERESGWVARAAMVSKSGLTTLCAELERRGLIQRRVDADDRRKSLVRLSAPGEALMRQVFGRVNRADSAFASSLDPDQKRQLMELLGALARGPRAHADFDADDQGGVLVGGTLLQ